MKYKEYSDEFKLQVVNEYLKEKLGCRLLAKKYNLPSKNYIFRWKDELEKKGLLEKGIKKDLTKMQKSSLKSKNKTPYEKQLEKENFQLKAELAFYKELKKLIDDDNKKKE